MLRQDIYLMSAKLRFDRRTEQSMLDLAHELVGLGNCRHARPARRAVMIEFQQVSRSYGDKLAVDNLNLRVKAGELYSLLGHNGAGKTTAIKMLVGLIRPGQGTIRVGGYDVVTDTRQAVSLIGYVPDQPFLYDKLTGRELLQFVARMYGMDTDQATRAMNREIERFELAEFVERPDGNLLPRHEATNGVRLGPAAQTARAGGRRADGRPRSAQHPRGEGLAAMGSDAGDVRVDVDAHAGRGRGNFRPRGHHESQPAGV